MKTYSMKASEVDKKHYVVDADGVVLGRMAAVIATVLRGKNKLTFTPSMTAVTTSLLSMPKRSCLPAIR